ncbi:MAG: hydantoinase/oxoprolinase family protein [Bryobacteraceae bacterium]
MRIGIDAGGTFTDFVVAHEDGSVETFKIRSNPAAPAKVILEGLARVGAGATTDVVHGSTVATNALLERKGARAALVTTAGFEDVIQIGRQNRERLYDLTPPPRRGLVSREMCFGVTERAYFDGTIAARPSQAELRRLKRRLSEAGVEAVAVCFLHAYRNAENELAVLEALRGLGVYLCASHEVCPEFREYERTSTTLLNAYVGPLMDRYLAELEQGSTCRISIMQSNGGLITASEARSQAVRTLLSGPAGGVVGAIEMARLSGFEKVLGFDMGGTSTDVSLSEGTPRMSMEASVDGFPVRVPMFDIHTVGAGGGSIARVDEGGLLRVGPESAGAVPGPACYGTGTLATVTDAHVVLGRITALLGGTMALDKARAAAAVDVVAGRLGLSRVKAAEGILRVANANMERAIRVVSVERGYDPRDFALVAFGGCGGLHACEMAEDLGIRTVVAPRYAGVLSAVGMLMADRVRDYAAGVLGRDDIEATYRTLEKRARRDLRGAKLMRSADVRYVGQSYELTVGDVSEFHGAHERIYGYADRGRPLELVTVRVTAVKAVDRLQMGQGQKKKPVAGPALIADYGSTTYVPRGWIARTDKVGNLVISR